MEIIKRFKNFFNKKNKITFEQKIEILNDYFLDIKDLGIKTSFYDKSDDIRIYLEANPSNILIDEKLIITIDDEIKNTLSHLSQDFKIISYKQYILSIEGHDDITTDGKLIKSRFHELYMSMTQNQNSESDHLTKISIKMIIDISF